MTPTTTLNDLYNEIVAVLKTVVDPTDTATYLFQNTDASWNIYDGPQTQWTGTPAAIIIPADGPASKFESNYQNIRGYGFYVFIAMDTELTNYSQTRINMRLITDGILDAIDRSNMLNNVADIVEAMSLKWIEEESSTGVNIVAPLEIVAKKLVMSASA